MAYRKGDTIAAADYNNFVGEPGAGTNKATVAFASDLAATEKVAALYGVGYGNRGYGQISAQTLPNKAAGDTIGNEWTALRAAIAQLASHQGTATTLLPPANLLETGDIITAHEQDAPSSNAYDFQNMIANVDAGRNNKTGWAPSSHSILTHTRTSAWTSSIVCELSATFTSVDNTRFFFNTGGELLVDLSHGTGTSQDNDWNSILGTVIGTITLNYTQTTISGTSVGVDTVASIGYYDLTDSYQTIVDATDVGSGAYSSNDVLIEARRASSTTTNGGNGNGVVFRITLSDQHVGSGGGPDSVAAGTQAVITARKATDLTNAMETPTGAVVESFDT